MLIHLPKEIQLLHYYLFRGWGHKGSGGYGEHDGSSLELVRFSTNLKGNPKGNLTK